MELHNFLSGFLVIIPDYYRSGKFCDVTKESGETIQAFLKEHSVLANLKKDFDTFVLPYAEKNGCKSIGTFGFCWGSVPVIHFSSFDQVSYLTLPIRLGFWTFLGNKRDYSWKNFDFPKK